MKRTTLIILALLFVGVSLRVWNLTSQSIWWDEAFTWQMASHGWGNFWSMLLTGDRNPPLYFLTIALWGTAAGWSEFSLRFLSVTYMVIGLAFLANLARRLFDAKASAWALAVAAFSPALIGYAQEGRMYALFFALTAVTLYFGVLSLDSRSKNRGSEIRDRRLSWPFIICEASLLLTHYFAIPLMAALNVFVLNALFRRRANWREYLKWLGGQALAALPMVVWVIVVASTPGNLSLAHEPPPDVLAFAYQVITFWMTGVRAPDPSHIPLVLGALGLIVIASIGAWLSNRSRTLLVVAFSIVSMGAAFVLTNVITSFHPRYLLPYVIPLFVLIGGALASIRSVRKWRIALGGLTLVGAIGATWAGWNVAGDPKYAKDDARGVAAYLKEHAAADDVILSEANDYTLAYYDHGPAPIKMITATTESEAFQQLSDAVGSAKRVWLVHWNISTQDPRGYWRFLFEQSGSMQDWTSYRGYESYCYDMQSLLREPDLSKDAPVQPGLVYFDKWSGIDGQGEDGALTFAIRWPHLSSIYDAVSIRLQDAAGTPLASEDVPLLDKNGNPGYLARSTDALMNYYVLPIPPGTPPLTYTVVAQLYAIESMGSPNSISEGTVLRVDNQLASIRLPRRLNTNDPYRTLAGYAWQRLSALEVMPGLTLEGVALVTRSPKALQTIDVTLRWLKTGEVANYTPRLRLEQNGRVWAEVGSDLFEREYPIEQWANNETVIDRLKITYPPVLGQMQLQIGQGDRWITLATLALDQSALKFEPPTMPHIQSAKYGNLAELLGYELKSDSIGPNRLLDLTLYWRALNTDPITTSFTVFTQLIAPDGHLVAQHDAPPYPATLAWVPEQIIEDRHALTVVDATYRGPAMLIVGWYNSATIARVQVLGGGDFVTLATPIRVDEK